MAVRAEGAVATMETPMRNKLETLEGFDSPDSVFLFDSAETAEKVWQLHGDSPEDDIDNIRRLYKDLGLDYGKMKRLLSRIDEHFITYSTPTHPSVTTERLRYSPVLSPQNEMGYAIQMGLLRYLSLPSPSPATLFGTVSSSRFAFLVIPAGSS